MDSFVRIQPKPANKRKEISETAKLWRQFKKPTTISLDGACTGLTFSPTAPYECAVACGTRVDLFPPGTSTPSRAVSKFTALTYGCAYRRDGQVMGAGDEAGAVSVFAMRDRSLLRKMTGHTSAARWVSFMPDMTKVASGSNDHTVRWWDITRGECVGESTNHEDAVRAGVVTPLGIMTGDLGGVVQLWDPRAPETSTPLFETTVSDSVFSMTALGDHVIAVAAGKAVKIIDVAGKDPLLRTLECHSGEVMATAAIDGYLVTAGLDGVVNVHSREEDYRMVWNRTDLGPLTELAVSPDLRHVAAGTSSGTITFMHRGRVSEEAPAAVKPVDALPFPVPQFKTGPRAGTRRYWERKDGGPEEKGESIFVPNVRKQKLRTYDTMLKAFDYKRAIDVAVREGRPDVTVSVLYELLQRDVLETALASLNEAMLTGLLHFVAKNIDVPAYTGPLVTVAHVLVDLYASSAGDAGRVDELLQNLMFKAKAAMALGNEMEKLRGLLDGLF